MSRDFRFEQPAWQKMRVCKCTHNCKHTAQLAQEGGQQGIKFGGVGNACNLPRGKQWAETSAVSESIMGVPAH